MSGGAAEDGRQAEAPKAKEADAGGAEAATSGSKGPDGMAPVAEAAAPKAVDLEAPGATPPASAAGTPRQSEWTVSDHRGPLRAPTENDRTADETERPAPGGEIEGTHDVPAATEATEAIGGSPGIRGGVAGPAKAPAEAKRSALPIAAGLIVGALIGGGGAALVYALQPSVPPEVSGKLAELSGKLGDLSTRLDAVEKRPDPQAAIGDLRNELHAFAGRVAALEKRPVPAAPAPTDGKPAVADGRPAAGSPASPPVAGAAAPPAGDVAGKVAALQAALDGLSKQDGARQAAVKDLAGKLDALQASLAEVQAASRSNTDAVKGQQRDLDGKLAALQTAVSGAQSQAGAVQSDLSAVQSEQKALAAKVGAPALAAAADSLVAQVEAGRPYRAQVEALARLGADPARLAVLRENSGAGVASAQALAAAFAPLADPVIAAGRGTSGAAGYGEQLKQGVLGLVNLRRADDTAGSGLGSRVTQLQADLAHGDVVGANGVWTALPAGAMARLTGETKAKAAAFGAQLKASAEALVAARALQAQSIDTLAAKKS